MYRTILLASFVAVAMPCAASADALTLGTALDRAVARSQATSAARMSTAAEVESAVTAAQLPDPVLRAGIDNVPVTGSRRFDTAADFMTMRRIGVAQEWVSADKREARAATATASVNDARSNETIVRARLRLQTALAFVDAYFARRESTLATAVVDQTREQVRLAQAGQRSAQGSASEVLNARVNVALVEDELSEVKHQSEVAELALTRWTGTAAGDELELPSLNITPHEADFVSQHPEVVMRTARVSLLRAEGAVAAQDRSPNWTWEVSYGQRQRFSDMVTVGVSIPIPLSRAERQDRTLASKLAAASAGQFELEEAKRSAQLDYQTELHELTRLRERLQQFRAQAIDDAEQRVALSIAAYRSGQGSVAAVYGARLDALAIQRKMLLLERDAARAWARLCFTPVGEGS